MSQDFRVCVKQSSGTHSLESYRGFERLVTTLSGALTNAAPEALDREVREGLRRLAGWVGVERSSLARFSDDGDALMVTHSFGAPAIPPRFRGVLPWYLEQLRRGRTLVMNQLPADLPAEAVAEREAFRTMRIGSQVAVPLWTAGRIWGVIALATSVHRFWMSEEVPRLRMVGELIAAAVQRHESEEATRRMREELVHVARVAALGELTAALTHELRQPLTAIRANAEATQRMVARGVRAAELDDALSDIVEEAGRATDLVSRLVGLFRRRTLEKIPIDVSKLVRDFHVIARAEARQHGADLALRLAPDLPQAVGDPVQLQQVLLNLVRNASEALANIEKSVREVEVSTSLTSAGEITVSVRDSGSAIDDAAFNQLFRPFYTTKPDGLGMGLAISRSIVMAHGGRLWAERCATSGGLVMNFTLPASTTEDRPQRLSTTEDGQAREVEHVA